MSKSQPITHDYTRLGWGHNITFTSISEAELQADAMADATGTAA